MMVKKQIVKKHVHNVHAMNSIERVYITIVYLSTLRLLNMTVHQYKV